MKKVNSNCDKQEIFYHSGVIISAVFYKVFQIFSIFYKKTVIFPTYIEYFNTWIGKDTKYFLYFENYICALDGIYLPAYISALLATFYWNQKGCLSQDVLVIF